MTGCASQTDHSLDTNTRPCQHVASCKHRCTTGDDVVDKPDAWLRSGCCQLIDRRSPGFPANAKAAALIDESLLQGESVLANRFAAPTQQLQRFPFQAAAESSRQRVGSFCRLPSRDRHQQAVGRQFLPQAGADRSKLSGVAALSQMQDHAPQFALIPANRLPGQWCRAIQRLVWQAESCATGLAGVNVIRLRCSARVAEAAAGIDQQVRQTSLE